MANMIAKTILEQLGGGMFAMMTGSKDFTGLENGLQFKVGRNDCGVNFVRIILDVNDTYRMEFCRFRSLKVTILSVKTDVYCDQLRGMFTDQTGLICSLGTMGR